MPGLVLGEGPVFPAKDESPPPPLDAFTHHDKAPLAW